MRCFAPAKSCVNINLQHGITWEGEREENGANLKESFKKHFSFTFASDTGDINSNGK